MKFQNLQELRKQLVKSVSLAGGSIAQTSCVHFRNHQQPFLLKTGYESPDQFFSEAEGLEYLKKSRSIRTPNVICCADDFLLLEYIEAGSPKSNFWQIFGRQLATLHQQTTNELLGFNRDNYLGKSVQKNTPHLNYSSPESWADFFWTYRLDFQWQLCKKTGQETPELNSLMLSLRQKCLDLLAMSTDAPCLLHGDLWSGNYVVDQEGLPVLIDPAVYYGNREAELAMTSLFGGFPPEFYKSYEETWPLPKGWRQRQSLYKLYHLMNHLNLFGHGYYHDVIKTLTVIKNEL